MHPLQEPLEELLWLGTKSVEASVRSVVVTLRARCRNPEAGRKVLSRHFRALFVRVTTA